jgi:hypothetical protein
MASVSVQDARDMFMQIVRQLPFYGFHLFPITHSSNWNMPQSVYIGINLAGIFFLSATKQVYRSFSFLDVVSHVSTPYVIQLAFEGGQSILCKTICGDEITSLLIDYKYAELKKTTL